MIIYFVHSLHDSVGEMKIYSPEKNQSPHREYDFSWMNGSSYLPNIHATNCYTETKQDERNAFDIGVHSFIHFM